jgi:hypothetical protein
MATKPSGNSLPNWKTVLHLRITKNAAVPKRCDYARGLLQVTIQVGALQDSGSCSHGPEREERYSAGSHKMLMGDFRAAFGLAVTGVTYAARPGGFAVIAYGAVIVGAIKFISGVGEWRESLQRLNADPTDPLRR